MKKKNYFGFWGVEGALCKILEILGQHPQRNYLSKSATFDPIFQLLHSVVGWKVDLVTGFSFKEVPIKDAHMFDILSYQNIANLGNVFARRDVASFHASSRIEGSSEQYNVQLRIEREKES